MSAIVDLEKLSHRSKSRIKNLGEVFTPESYVEDMLAILAKNKKNFWADEEISFFEPCAGHGNIVLSIYKRRLEGIYKKAISRGAKEATYYSIANSISTLWAIDIDSKNIENCRSRVLSATLDFLKSKLETKSDFALFSKKKDFFAHLLSAIRWHIRENETLSALSNPQFAKANAKLTKSGNKWFSQNGHHQLDFSLTWVRFYKECDSDDTVPLDYERSIRFIESFLSGKIRGFEDFDFAKAIINIDSTDDRRRNSTKSISAGA